MPSFNFRIRFELAETDRIEALQSEIVLYRTPDHTLVLRAGTLGQPINSVPRAAIIGGPYDSEAEARGAAERSKSAILLWAVKEQVGVNLGDGKQRSIVTDYGRELVSAQIGRPVRNDLHGIDIYEPLDGIAFVSFDAKLQIGRNTDALVSSFAAGFERAAPLSGKQLLACELFSSSLFDTSHRSRLITLVSAVEALLEPPRRSDAALGVVDSIEDLVRRSDLPTIDKDAMLGSIQWLKQDSIGQTGRAAARSFLSGREYEGQSAERFFSLCYDTRSQLLHSGATRDLSVDVERLATEARRFVSELLQAAIERTAT